MRTMQTYNRPQPRPIFFNDWRIKLNFGRLMPAKRASGQAYWQRPREWVASALCGTNMANRLYAVRHEFKIS